MPELAEKKERKGIPDSDLQKIGEALKDIAFGSVLISVQDGKIVQIEKNEKFRLK